MKSNKACLEKTIHKWLRLQNAPESYENDLRSFTLLMSAYSLCFALCYAYDYNPDNGALRASLEELLDMTSDKLDAQDEQ